MGTIRQFFDGDLRLFAKRQVLICQFVLVAQDCIKDYANLRSKLKYFDRTLKND